MEYLDKPHTIQAIQQRASQGMPFVFLISFRGEKNLVASPDEAASAGLLLEMPGIKNHRLKKMPGPEIQWRRIPPDREDYYRAFRHVHEQIHYGNSFLLNLTQATFVETNLSLPEIFTRSRAPFKLLLKDKLVVFSPERFVRIEGRTISSNPMKGTMDASVPGAYRLLASDPKEDAEHNTIVDLIRNDLSLVAKDVRVKRFKYIEKIRTHQGELLQMSSEITGKLPADFRENLGDLLFSMLPAGSICGAPKKKTVEIILNTEGYERGFYTGVFGHFDGKNLDSAVCIRYLEQQEKQMVFKSGGGITFMSEWQSEYEEMQNKVYVPVY